MFGPATLAVLIRLLLPPGGPDLEATAQQASGALLRHDAAAIIGQSPRLLVQLPGVAPSGPVPRSQAIALLASYLHDYEEVAVSVASVQSITPSKGVVQLVRRYRVPGTDDTRSQSVLLSYELSGGIWSLTELRISG
jgi:hypothetical protein